MRRTLISTFTTSLLIGGLLIIGGCEEYHAAEDAQPATQQQQPAAPGAEGRRSTLGKAMDAGERTRDRMDEYHQRVLDEADDFGQP